MTDPSPQSVSDVAVNTRLIISGSRDTAVVVDLSKTGGDSYRLLLLDPDNLQAVLWTEETKAEASAVAIAGALHARRTPEFTVSARTISAGTPESPMFLIAIGMAFGKLDFTFVVGHPPSTKRSKVSPASLVRPVEYSGNKEAWVHAGEVLDYLKDYTLDWSKMALNKTEAAT